MSKPSKSKPFFRKQTKSWYVTLNGKQIPLGKDENEAHREYHQLMANYVRDEPAEKISINRDTTITNLFLAFLKWTHENRSLSTYKGYKHYCISLATYLPKSLKVSRLKRRHVEEWFKDQFPPDPSNPNKNNDNTKGVAFRSVKRAFNWAVEQEYIAVSPLKGLKGGSGGQPRDIYLEPKDFKKFLKAIPERNEALRNVVIFLWRTGCRPFEAATLEARHLGKGCAVFDVNESKGKRKKRIVPLDPICLELVNKLAEKYPTGPIFRNTHGTAWKPDTLHDGCERYGKKIGLKIIPYIFRHSFITRALLQGLNPIEVATIVGHQDLNMIQQVYSQLRKKGEHLQSLVAKVNA